MNVDFIVRLNLYMIVPIFIVGSFLHFAYNWSKHNKRLALFVSVNESYWEHIKLAFWPTFFLYLVEFIFGGFQLLSFIPAATVSLYVIPILMITIVYNYKHYTKKNILTLDIVTFFIVIVITQLVFNMILKQFSADVSSIFLSSLFLIFIVVAFVNYTKNPPSDPNIFKDPLTNKYGIEGHK